ncbi:MAG: TIGR04282 family arsenosugar biosynthesis glycosyltransferase [Candidatus Obscuribacterales bacterium]|nr:TIGR04282 family arsenosugar biosynthesis glycosyltransferase [Candidatus Obscuribacterales bacterium]
MGRNEDSNDWHGKVALVAFAKNPEAVPVKTRLARSLGEAHAAKLYTAFLKDCLTGLTRVEGGVAYLACYPETEACFFKQLKTEYGVKLIRQHGCNLGERMLNCAKELLGSYQAVIIFGTDVPVIPAESVRTALDGMRYWDVLLGPCPDGGYYALGVRNIADSMFSGVVWGSESVFLQTVKNCVNEGLEVSFLDLIDDIDDIEALRRLAGKLDVNRCIAVHTRGILEKIDLVAN